MKAPIILLLGLVSFSLSCGGGSSALRSSEANAVSAQAVAEPAKTEKGMVYDSLQQNSPQPQKVALTDVDKSGAIAEAAERKIIRNGEITLEVASTTDAQHRVASIAEANGGFVVTSESKQRENVDPAQRTLDIKLVVRVPSPQFGVAFDEIKKLASNTPQENVSGQDVTEEFIDLEARIKTQKALELQFLEIMRQANKVADALEVQRQIADVRTDIEKLEGRKRFLENRASLSTITVNIQTPKPAITVTSTGFGRELRDAVSESIGVASDIVLFFTRFAIVMIPIFIFVILPAGFIGRYLVRRAKRMRLAQALATPSPE
ncbi:MAG TPA: DUF4349 domain-containing protein [Pyrinomonadaceae bacterium]|nr:DUF4349 domain-containing protein [Pyrinomonadaceae bacterium]